MEETIKKILKSKDKEFLIKTRNDLKFALMNSYGLMKKEDAKFNHKYIRKNIARCNMVLGSLK